MDAVYRVVVLSDVIHEIWVARLGHSCPLNLPLNPHPYKVPLQSQARISAPTLPTPDSPVLGHRREAHAGCHDKLCWLHLLTLTPCFGILLRGVLG